MDSQTRQYKEAFAKKSFAQIMAVKKEKCKRSFSFFIKEFWDTIVNDKLIWNWHMDYLCEELQDLALHTMARLPKPYDLIINIPPGTSKSTICTQMFPCWCWIAKVPIWSLPFPYLGDGPVTGQDLQFITGSYSATLSLEHSELSRDIIRSEKFKMYFPEIYIKRDKDTKQYFKINKGGSRYSTSVGGTVTGMHGHFIIIDDPLNPYQATSDVERETANKWIDSTLSSRKVDKKLTPTILIMQRLHVQDPTGHILLKRKAKVKHIRLPGDDSFKISPAKLKKYYINGLLDSVRHPREVLDEMRNDLGAYQYSSQVGQEAIVREGAMFQKDFFEIVEAAPAKGRVVRGWDLAGTSSAEAFKKKRRPAYTCGVRIKESGKTFYVEDVFRERVGPKGVRDAIKNIASQDGKDVTIDLPQDPGQAGKAQVQDLAFELAGYKVKFCPESGDKTLRAEPFASQCEAGNVKLVRGSWNTDFLDELMAFPNSEFKDQVDGSVRAFSRLRGKKKKAGTWGRR